MIKNTKDLGIKIVKIDCFIYGVINAVVNVDDYFLVYGARHDIDVAKCIYKSSAISNQKILFSNNPDIKELPQLVLPATPNIASIYAWNNPVYSGKEINELIYKYFPNNYTCTYNIKEQLFKLTLELKEIGRINAEKILQPHVDETEFSDWMIEPVNSGQTSRCIAQAPTFKKFIVVNDDGRCVTTSDAHVKIFTIQELKEYYLELKNKEKIIDSLDIEINSCTDNDINFPHRFLAAQIYYK